MVIFCSAKPKDSNCLLEIEAVTALWPSKAVLMYIIYDDILGHYVTSLLVMM